jgi:hypothetical protein
MKNKSNFRLLTLAGVFALLAISLSSCFYGGGYGYNSRYYGRPYSYGYRYRPPVRVYVAPQKRYYSHNDNYRRNYGSNNHYRGNNGNYRSGRSRNGRR